MVKRLLYLATASLAVGSAAAGQAPKGVLPDGKGKEQVKKICTGCHEAATVTGSRRTRIGWERNVDDMVARGAEGSDEDLDAVVEYLTHFFGKINVNTASSAGLQSVLGLSDKDAEAIIAYRERSGAIKNFEQLTAVPGVDVEKLEAKRSLIAFSL